MGYVGDKSVYCVYTFFGGQVIFDRGLLIFELYSYHTLRLSTFDTQ
jgi:hypothetical protein